MSHNQPGSLSGAPWTLAPSTSCCECTCPLTLGEWERSVGPSRGLMRACVLHHVLLVSRYGSCSNTALTQSRGDYFFHTRGMLEYFEKNKPSYLRQASVRRNSSFYRCLPLRYYLPS